MKVFQMKEVTRLGFRDRFLILLAAAILVIQDSLRNIPGLGQSQMFFTIGIAAALFLSNFLLLFSRPNRLTQSKMRPTHVFLFVLFIGLAVYSVALNPRESGFQNVLVWALVPMTYLVTLRGNPENISYLIRSVKVSINIAASIYLLSLLALFLGIIDFTIYGNRSAGWVFALTLAFLAPKLASEKSIGFAVLPFLAVLFSLSRTAGVVALLAMSILIVLRITNTEIKLGIRAVMNLVLSFATLLGAAWLVFSSLETVQSRFIGGDNFEFGGVQINTSGRGTIWTFVLSGIQNHFWFGAGPGASQDLISGIFAGRVEHPHNEYLRIWYDLGLVGLAIFVSAWMLVIFLLIRAATRETNLDFRAAQIGSAILVLGFLAGCFTDNVTIYFFLVYPLALVTGFTLGTQDKNKKT
jgi:O-antigen ligase